MPLPRLQIVGRQHDPILYQIGRDLGIERRRRAVIQYQQGKGGDFDNLIRLQSGVGEWLVRLNGLLRPLIHRGWASVVAQMNGLRVARLETFLFGAERVPLDSVRPGLIEMQQGRCFYCGAKLVSRAEVDHFIPWSRYPDNGIENLLVADARCNGSKRDFLAASRHLSGWSARNRDRGPELAEIAARVGGDSHAERTLGVARGVYLRLAEGTPLWLRGQEFDRAVTADLSKAIA